MQDGTVHCPFCGVSLSGVNDLVREKLAEARHNEIISEIGAFFGLFLIALGWLVVQPATLTFVLVGLLFLFVGATSSLYYSLKRRKLLKQLT